jgi:glutathione S-transferase
MPELLDRLNAIEATAARLFGQPVSSVALLYPATGTDLLGWQAYAEQYDSATWLRADVQPVLEQSGQARHASDRRQYRAGVRRYAVWRKYSQGTWHLSHRDWLSHE